VGATVVTGSALAQEPAQTRRVKGPPVWLDMDQKELDDAYDQSVWAPNQQQVTKRRAVWSESISARLKPERFAYGPTEIETLDIYKTTRWNAPIRIFIHGGAWRGGSAKDSAYPAEMFVTSGAHYVAVDFVSVGDVSGNLMPMADQCGAPWPGSIRMPPASAVIQTASTSQDILPAPILPASSW
jgi:arylformamidase